MAKTCIGFWAMAAICLGVLGCGKGKCEPCSKDGECSSGLVCHPQSHICKASTDLTMSCPADCPASKECLEGGLCTLRNGKCLVATDEDCRRSGACTNEGRCNRQDLGALGTCVSVSKDDCRKSTACRTLGRCSLSPRTRDCQVVSDDDCAKAEICIKEKKCKANDGACATAGPAAP